MRISSSQPRSVILLFVDGVGVGPRDPAVNPFARLPRTLLGRFVDEISFDCAASTTGPAIGPGGHVDSQPGAVASLAAGSSAGPLPFGGFWKPLDATLGVPGLPQSATGQATILTGRNVPQIVGGHVSAVPDRRVRAVLEKENLLSLLVRAGRRPTFANAYTPVFFERKRPHISVTTRSMLAAGLELRRIEDLLADRAVYHDYTNRFLISPPRPALAGRSLARARQRGQSTSAIRSVTRLAAHADRHGLPALSSPSSQAHSPAADRPIRERTAEEAADILLSLAREHDFVLHEHFLTDLAGHRGDEPDREEAARRIEALVEAVAARAAGEEVLFLIVSDHGNLEDGSTRLHTRNPVPFLAWGPGAPEALANADDLTCVTPAVLEALGVGRAE